MQSLTKEQAEMVAKNHNLIYSFMKSRHLFMDDNSYKNNDDFYGIVAEAFCQAAATYDEDKKCPFSTYAYKCMDNAMHTWDKMRRVQKKVPSYLIDYLGAPVTDDEEEDKMDYLPSDVNIENEVLSKISFKQITEGIDEKQSKIYELILQGYKIVEIADIVGLSKQGVSARVKRDKKRVSRLL